MKINLLRRKRRIGVAQHNEEVARLFMGELNGRLGRKRSRP